jgi:RNA 2',3'-cyclic 3'-phosphodiesterase
MFESSRLVEPGSRKVYGEGSIRFLWDPYIDRGTSRLLFIVRADSGFHLAIKLMSENLNLADRLDGSALSLDLLHQSVSVRYLDTLEIRERLLRAGDTVQAAAFTLELDRLRSAPNPWGSYNWEVRSRRKSPELSALVAAIDDAIAMEGLPRGGGHSAHVTLCYSAANTLSGEEPIVPIGWAINTFELVVGEQSSRGYSYTTLRRWQLGPEAPRAVQMSMF